MDDTVYLERTNAAFEPPVHPGVQAVPSTTATNAQISEANRIHLSSLNKHQKYIDVQQAIKSQILIAIPHRYINILESDEMGYTDVTQLVMIQHLKKNYGKVFRDKIENNSKELLKQWSPEEPIKELWKRIRNFCHFVKNYAKKEISEAAAIHLTIEMFETNKLFVFDCKD